MAKPPKSKAASPRRGSGSSKGKPAARKAKPTGAKAAAGPRKAATARPRPTAEGRTAPRRPAALNPRAAGKGPTRPKVPAVKRSSPARVVPGPLTDDSIRPIALAAVEAALDKKGEEPVLLDVRSLSSYADYVLLLSAESERQVDALARAIEEKLRSLGTRLRSTEAAGESNWLLLDFGDLVVHVFYREARGFYDLEGLWADAPRVPLGSLWAAAGAPR